MGQARHQKRVPGTHTQARPASLMIGNTNGGTLTAQFVMSLVNTKEALPSVEYRHCSGPYLVDNRNRLVGEFLREGMDWLLMIDSDVEWEPAQVGELLAVGDAIEMPVVSGLYYSQLGPVGVVPTPVAWSLDRQQVPAGSGLVECTAFGAGFLLMHRRVLRQLVAVHGRAFECEYPAGEDLVSEDFVFCRRVRDLGLSVFVHSDVVVGHAKTMVLRPLFGLAFEENAVLAEAAA